MPEHAQCARCDETAECARVASRTRYLNGNRARTGDKPICGYCATVLVLTYKLTTEAETMGPSYFVEGWHADGLLIAADVLGGAHA